ncbi:MAG: methyltransferase regulatory domain-containing protein [Planctomycetales bacterium]|nr:methyltransferase regulatory domain-containing protein [Planctomycetales bacterium]
MTLESAIAKSYDDLPYPSGPQPLTHPRHLSMIGTLFGFPAVKVDQCRVLEIGCAGGGNILPMAFELPQSRFVGIDISARQINEACESAKRLALDNIEFQRRDILELNADFGQFDYIICHGVFSWVPKQVQDHILSLGKQLLGPQGIMYVSYNTYPGWHMRGIARDMLAYHARKFETIGEKLAQGRSLLDFLIHSPDLRDETYRQILKDEVEHLTGHHDAYIFHEHFEENNTPLYFHEFFERVTAHELRYLGDANVPELMKADFDEATQKLMRDVSLLEQEQFTDFLTARTFRRSLVCHPDQPLDRNIGPIRLTGLSFALAEPLQIEGEDALATTFVGQTKKIATDHPFLEALLCELVKSWPSWVTVEELVYRARDVLEDDTDSDLEDSVFEDLLLLLARGVVLASPNPTQLATSAGPLPKVSGFVRAQCTTGRSVVTNLRHAAVSLSPWHQHLCSFLDGSHSREDLRLELQRFSLAGEPVLPNSSSKVFPISRDQQLHFVDQLLQDLVECYLLTA